MSHRRTGITADDMSQAMVPFLGEIKNPRKLLGSIAMAFDFVVISSKKSWASDPGGFEDERPSDEVVDKLFVELAPERRKIERQWDLWDVLESLRKRAQNMAVYGVYKYCCKPIELLSTWKWSLPEDAVLAPPKKSYKTSTDSSHEVLLEDSYSSTEDLW